MGELILFVSLGVYFYRLPRPQSSIANLISSELPFNSGAYMA